MEFFKQEMLSTISKMREDTLIQTQERINKLFKMAILAQSLGLKIPTTPIGSTQNFVDDIALADLSNTINPTDMLVEPISKPISKPISEPLGELIQDADIVSATNAYPLDRKLRGGIVTIPGIIQPVFVPEKVIRQQGLVHGDFLQVENNNNTYSFQKVKDSVTAHESDRVEVDYCVISKSHEGFLISDKYFSDGKLRPIMLNEETPLTFLISGDDKAKYNLKEGMFVTIAYLKSNPLCKRVCWAYSDEAQPHVTPKPTSYYRESKGEKTPIWSVEEQTLLEGKKVVLLGADFKKLEINSLAKAGNFEIAYLTGYEDAKRLENTMQSADLILSATAHLSHRAAEIAKRFGKQCQIPHRIVQTSLCSIKNGLIHGFQNQDQKIVSLFN